MATGGRCLRLGVRLCFVSFVLFVVAPVYRTKQQDVKLILRIFAFFVRGFSGEGTSSLGGGSRGSCKSSIPAGAPSGYRVYRNVYHLFVGKPGETEGL